MTEIRMLQRDDRQEVLQFLRQQFSRHEQLSTESFLAWRYEQNPLVRRGDQLSMFVACHRGQIVAFMGAIADRLWDGHTWHDCQWLVNLIVAPEYRGGLDGLQLFEHAASRCPLTLTTGAGPHMRRLYQALGWRQLSVCDTIYFPLRPAGLWRMAADTGRGARWIPTVSGGAVASLVSGLWRPLATLACQRWRLPASAHTHPRSYTSRTSTPKPSRDREPSGVDPAPFSPQSATLVANRSSQRRANHSKPMQLSIVAAAQNRKT